MFGRCLGVRATEHIVQLGYCSQHTSRDHDINSSYDRDFRVDAISSDRLPVILLLDPSFLSGLL